jgi:hypothetical protein
MWSERTKKEGRTFVSDLRRKRDVDEIRGEENGRGRSEEATTTTYQRWGRVALGLVVGDVFRVEVVFFLGTGVHVFL